MFTPAGGVSSVDTCSKVSAGDDGGGGGGGRLSEADVSISVQILRPTYYSPPGGVGPQLLPLSPLKQKYQSWCQSKTLHYYVFQWRLS